MRYPIIRGILLGGSIGVFAVLFGLADSMPRGLGLGMVGGALAGLTMKWRQGKKTKPSQTTKQ